MKRLSGPTGAVSGNVIQSDDAIDKIVRPAIIIHAGPNKSKITLQSGDGPIEFDEARIKRIVNIHNSNREKLIKEYGGDEKTPIGAFQPILDQHSDDSSDRVIGRLSGKLNFEYRNIPKVGDKVPCAVCEGITWLGEETVKRVKDGRIFHLSIGINEEDDTLGETSAVIEPAAPGAMVLRKGIQKKDNGGSMSKRLEAHKARLTQLKAMKETVTTLSTKMVSTSDRVELSKKESGITARVRELVKLGKMTPAEFRNLSAEGKFTKLAKLDKEHLDIALSAFESREKPVIVAGQIGSTIASDFSELGTNMENKQKKRLRAEFSSDLKRLTGKKLSGADDEKKEKDLAFGAEDDKEKKEKSLAAPGEKEPSKLSAHMEEMKKHLEAGDVESAKSCYSKMAEAVQEKGEKHLEEGSPAPVEQKSLEELQSDLNEVKTQLARMGGMVSELMSSEEAEGTELAKEDENVDGDKKDLAAGDEEKKENEDKK